jgi:mannitol-1-phosphate 5-dehydrogenase
MYGAGSVGRGFIGPLFAQAGYEVVYVDIDRRVVDAFNERREYNYTVAAEPPYEVPVTGVRGVDGMDELAVLDEIAQCDLMATSLGVAALQKVSPLIARGFSLRMRQSGRPLNLLICENLKDAAQILRGWISAALPEEDKPLLDERFGLIETAIGRMIPPSLANDADPLKIVVEEYGFLPVDKDAYVGAPPDIPGLIPFTPFSFYEERKLYLHNMGHAICAYLGMRKGCVGIDDAISDPEIRIFTQSAMIESAAMLSKKYDMPFARIFDHAEDLLLRFSNAALSDTCERVGRDPMRKIKAGDRFAGALCQCWEYKVYPVYIALGYAAALRNVTENEIIAEKLARETGGLDDEKAALVMKLFAALPMPNKELLREAERIKKELRGSIV